MALFGLGSIVYETIALIGLIMSLGLTLIRIVEHVKRKIKFVFDESMGFYFVCLSQNPEKVFFELDLDCKNKRSRPITITEIDVIFGETSKFHIPLSRRRIRLDGYDSEKLEMGHSVPIKEFQIYCHPLDHKVKATLSIKTSHREYKKKIIFREQGFMDCVSKESAERKRRNETSEY